MRMPRAVVVTAAMLIGCGGPSTTENPTPETPAPVIPSPADPQSQMSTVAGRVGTATGATKVQVTQIQPDGSLKVLATGDVVGGAYSFKTPAGQENLVVQALDASGGVLASAILEVSAGVDLSVIVAPFDLETTVEAAVLIDLVVKGVMPLGIGTAADIRARIDAGIAAEMFTGGEMEQESIAGLSDAMAAAVTTKAGTLKSMTSAGNISALTTAQHAASVQLNQALDAGDPNAQTTFQNNIHLAQVSAGLNAEGRLKVEANASVAVRAVLGAKLGKDAAMIYANAKVAAALEARVTVDSLLATLDANSIGMTPAISADVKSATDDFHANLKAAVDLAGIIKAYAELDARLSAAIHVALGLEFGVGLCIGYPCGIAAHVDLGLVAKACINVQADLDADLRLGILPYLNGSGDLDGLASAIVKARLKFQLSLEAELAVALNVDAIINEEGLDVQVAAEVKARARAMIDTQLAVSGALRAGL